MSGVGRVETEYEALSPEVLMDLLECICVYSAESVTIKEEY